jgi:hypothetical protein
MRLVRVALPIAVVLLASSPGSAQPLQSVQGFVLRVNLGARLQIEDQSGAKTTGRLTHLTRDEITIQTDAGEKRFASAIVREVAVRRRPLRKGVLIGAGLAAVLGALTACIGADRSECADSPILAGGLGGGLGLAVSALIPRTTTVYRAPTDMAPSGGSARSPGPFDDLALRVNLNTQMRVEDQSGAKTTGRLARLTGDEMAIETDAGEKRFSSTIVREVAVRSHPLGKGALIGAGVVAALDGIHCANGPPTPPGVQKCGVPFVISGGVAGATIGLVVGALIPGMTSIYRAQEKHASFSPVFLRGTIGVQAGLRW